ncbi:Lipoyltransferase and lipoate-protein ligase [Obba rivulosa]|uniref:Putative lipoate-protein ligase A n=1 Tax=Obba rivulosa TaxID=1052685 RepID=A0A8E2DR69_9APHY|nr:Lipoyltransferase and lipoate-protein ligase [Obba rivulosa]
MTTFLRHARRAFSTGSEVLSPSHSIYVSNSTNPYFNLSLEDWLFRHKCPREPLLLLYRDRPCVVIGRNQNPWKEVNMRASRRTGVPFIRRRSGGGTVYHDLGNTNFSIHLPRASFDRHATGEVVLGAVRSLGVDARLNDRNDICVGPDKVSGSAYKIVNNRAYHHGTMLIASRLDLLGDLLHTDKDRMDTRGVASVRSPVRNLQQYDPAVSHERFVDAVINAFKAEYNVDEKVQYIDDEGVMENNEYIQRGMAELPSWQWAYGQTPEFTYTIQQTFEQGDITARIQSKHGLILECKLELPESVPPAEATRLREVAERLAGQRYGFVGENVLGDAIKTDEHCKAIWQWLKAKMDS